MLSILGEINQIEMNYLNDEELELVQGKEYIIKSYLNDISEIGCDGKLSSVELHFGGQSYYRPGDNTYNTYNLTLPGDIGN